MTLGPSNGGLSYAGFCGLVGSVWWLGNWLEELVLAGLLLPWVVVGTVYASRDILGRLYPVVNRFANTFDSWLQRVTDCGCFRVEDAQAMEVFNEGISLHLYI